MARTTTIWVPAPLADVHIRAIRSDISSWLADAVKTDIEILAPVDTGYMKTHVVVRDEGGANRRVVVLGAGIPPKAEVPAYVEYGTRPHDIPNAFGWGITVHHPGTRPQPFIRPAAYRKRVIPPYIVKARASGADR